MIQKVNSLYSDRRQEIKDLKPTYISSVELSYKGIDTKKLRLLCQNHPYYHAICFNISGTYKYWFERNTLNEMLKLTNQLIVKKEKSK